MSTCQAKKNDGQKCRNKSSQNSTRCWLHGRSQQRRQQRGGHGGNADILTDSVFTALSTKSNVKAEYLDVNKLKNLILPLITEYLSATDQARADGEQGDDLNDQLGSLQHNLIDQLIRKVYRNPTGTLYQTMYERLEEHLPLMS